MNKMIKWILELSESGGLVMGVWGDLIKVRDVTSVLKMYLF
jgi:hypothetical protein